MKSQITQHNLERLLTILKSRRDDKLAGESLTEMKGSLTPSEAKFLDFWKTLSFTAHHATQHWEEIERDGALRSVRDRLIAGSLNTCHTGGPARQELNYFTIGIGGCYLNPLFIGANPTLITLPLHYFNSKSRHAALVEKFSLGNHESWFSHGTQTDPIEINNIIRYIQFDGKRRTKTYRYYHKITGESWERSVKALEEVFYAQGSCEFLLEVLGLQFILELSEFGGEVREKILKNPREHRKWVVRLFHQLFPSEIYPELQVNGSIPIDLHGISIKTTAPQTQRNSDALRDAILCQDEKKIDQLLAAGVSLEDVSVCTLVDCLYEEYEKEEKHYHTPVMTAFISDHYDIGFKLIRRGANIQTISLNHPAPLLRLVIHKLELAKAKAKEYDVLHQMMEGIEIPKLPGLKQHFSLSHRDFLGVLDIITLFNLCQPQKQDDSKVQELKGSILLKLKQFIPIYRSLGLLANWYHTSIADCKNSPFNSQQLSTLNWFLEQKCEVGDDFIMQSTSYLHLDGLKWAIRHNGTIHLPSHPFSPFRVIIRYSENSSKKIEVLKWLLEKKPLACFTLQDLNCIARLLKSPKTQQFYSWTPGLLEEMEGILTATAEAKAVFSEISNYPVLDHAVGAVIFVTVHKKVFTLLITRSEYLANQLIHYCGPGGLVELGEDPISAVCREVFEETQLEIDPKSIQTSVICEHKESKRHLNHELHIIDLGTRSALPLISAHSDALAAEWVDIRELKRNGNVLYYKQYPILRSNSEAIQARQRNEPAKAALIKRSLFLESALGKQQFETLISENKMIQAEKMIEEGVSVNAGKAMLLAMDDPERKPLLKKMISAGGDINKMRHWSTLIHSLYQKIESSSSLEEKQKQEKFGWLLQLITDFNVDWTKCVNPELSLANSLINDKRDNLLISLIERRKPLSDIFFNHIFKKYIENGRIEGLKALQKNYPQLAAQKIMDEKLILFSAEKSSMMFEWMLENGAKIPQQFSEKFYELYIARQKYTQSKIDHYKMIIKIAERYLEGNPDKISRSVLPKLSFVAHPQSSLDSGEASSSTYRQS